MGWKSTRMADTQAVRIHTAAVQSRNLTCASSSVVARGPNSRSLLCSMIGLLATRREKEHPWLR